MKHDNRGIPLWLRVIGGHVVWGLGHLKARWEKEHPEEGADVDLDQECREELERPKRRDIKAVKKDELKRTKAAMGQTAYSQRPDRRYKHGAEPGIDTP